MAREQEQDVEQEQLCYIFYLSLYHAPLREAMQLPAEPDRQEDENNVPVLVLVQKQVQVEAQVKAQQRPVFLGIDLVKQHTAVPNVQANDCK